MSTDNAPVHIATIIRAPFEVRVAVVGRRGTLSVRAKQYQSKSGKEAQQLERLSHTKKLTRALASRTI